MGFEPIDLPLKLLGFAIEVHTPQLVNLGRQALNLLVPFDNLPVALRDLLQHLCHRRLLLEHQGLELANGLYVFGTWALSAIEALSSLS